MRIIAGEFKGRRLRSPTGQAIRPTSDRAREALFNILEHGAPAVRGARFLDLFCGTGAIGLEAHSRGAREVVLVDNDNEALRLARANLERIGAPASVRLLARDATRLGPTRTRSIWSSSIRPIAPAWPARRSKACSGTAGSAQRHS